MKILLSVVGVGLGHATRSEAIYRELHKKADVKVITWGPAYDYFKKIGIPSGKVTGFDYKGEQYTFNLLINSINGISNPSRLRRDYFELAKQADEFKPDLVITDSDPNALFFANRRGIPSFTVSNLITTIDNYERIPKELRSRDLILQNFTIKRLMEYIGSRTKKIFVPSFEAKVKYRENVRYTDLIVRKRPNELPSEKILRKKIGIDGEFYLVSVGGSDIERYLFKVFRKVLPQFKDKQFIVSSNYMTDKVIEEENMKIFPFITNTLEYLKCSRGIISPGGHSTISEAICFRKPMLVVPIVNHSEQLINAALVKRDGFCEACFLKQNVSTQTVKQSIQDFFMKEEQIKNRLEAFKFKGLGAKEIAKDVLSY